MSVFAPLFVTFFLRDTDINIYITFFRIIQWHSGSKSNWSQKGKYKLELAYGIAVAPRTKPRCIDLQIDLHDEYVRRLHITFAHVHVLLAPHLLAYYYHLCIDLFLPSTVASALACWLACFFPVTATPLLWLCACARLHLPLTSQRMTACQARVHTRLCVRIVCSHPLTISSHGCGFYICSLLGRFCVCLFLSLPLATFLFFHPYPW